MSGKVEVLAEPQLEFGLKQHTSNPKTGLFFFGPNDTPGRPRNIKIGVVGTAVGLGLYRSWVKKINSYFPGLTEGSFNHLPYPGFESLLDASVAKEPERVVEISAAHLARTIRQGRRHTAVKDAVSIFESAIRENLEENFNLDVWFAVIPDDVYRYGRPNSVVPRGEAIKPKATISRRLASEILSGAPSLFQEDNELAESLLYEPNFHHQLKARLLDNRTVVLQIVRESTLEAIVDPGSAAGRRKLQDPASIAWNLSTTLFFKAGGQPWKLSYVRPRVCYIGVVFKLFPDTPSDRERACCGAQMFLDSGDGLVFRGTPGDYYDPKTKQFHLNEREASSLVSRVVQAFKLRDEEGLPPSELVIHGKTRFNSEEVRGFESGAPGIRVTTVRISGANDFRAYAPRDTPVLRGTSYQMSETRGYLWTKGFIPEIGTYQGREVPRPLSIELVSGQTELNTVMKDLLMLTKLNFNSCVYADGSPVTLRFADAVGEIITAIPEHRSMSSMAPMSFKHYI